MAKTQPIDASSVIYRRKHSVEVPEPMIGWCIVQLIEVETEGGIYMPMPGSTGMEAVPEDQQKPICKARVVKTSPEYPVNATSLARTPFGPGDYVLTNVNPRAVVETRLEVMLPKDHMAIWIADLAAWRPCPMDQSRKAES